jgi:hypothetical protein
MNQQQQQQDELIRSLADVGQLELPAAVSQVSMIMTCPCPSSLLCSRPWDIVKRVW